MLPTLTTPVSSVHGVATFMCSYAFFCVLFAPPSSLPVRQHAVLHFSRLVLGRRRGEIFSIQLFEWNIFTTTTQFHLANACWFHTVVYWLMYTVIDSIDIIDFHVLFVGAAVIEWMAMCKYKYTALHSYRKSARTLLSLDLLPGIVRQNFAWQN